MLDRDLAGTIYMYYVSNWISEGVLRTTYSVRLHCRRKRVINRSLTVSPFFLCIKYSKHRYLVEFYSIISKLVIWCSQCILFVFSAFYLSTMYSNTILLFMKTNTTNKKILLNAIAKSISLKKLASNQW